MRDIEAIESIVAGDSGGLAEAYDAYADSIYAYCRSVLGEADASADAVQTTFVVAAARADGLHDREHLRAWLFAIARDQCLRGQVRGQGHAPDPRTAPATIEIGTDAERALVRAAIDGLNPPERDVIMLFWHGLDVDDVTLVLGISRSHVYSVFSRARDQLEASVAVLLVGRRGRDDCDKLASLLGDWDGSLTVRLRDRISRHIAQCEVCTARRERELRPALLLSLSPGALLGAAEEARSSVPPAPPWLRDRMLWLVTTYDDEGTAEREKMESRAGSFGNTGFPKPRPVSCGWRPERPRLLIGTIVGVAAAAGLVAVLTAGGGSGAAPAGQASASHPQDVVASAPAGGGASSPVSSASGSPGASPSRSLATHQASSSPTHATRTAPAGVAPSTSTGSSGSSPTTGPPAAQGALTVSPSSITVVAPFSTTVTLTASGGTVNWSTSLPSSVSGELSVSPSSGTLKSGQSVSVSVTSNTASSFRTTLTVNPGGHRVAVSVGFG